MNYNILVTLPLTNEQKAALEKRAPTSIFKYIERELIKENDVKNTDIIIGNINNPSYLKNAHNLKFIQLNSAGYDDYTDVLPSTAKLANARGAYGLAVSEHTLGMLFEIKKKLHYYRDNQNNRLWKPMGKVTSIYNSKILITGLGDIGVEFAKKVKALGAYVIGIKRNIDIIPNCVDELYTLDKLNYVLPKVDVTVNILPASDDTIKLFNYSTLSLMKKNSIFINIGRGQSVDNSELCKLLNEGYFDGVGLDVFEEEPLPSDSPLWNIPRVVITPHIAGQFNLQYTLDRIVEISIYNLDAFVNNREIKNIVIK